MGRGQRTTCGHHFSPVMWVLGMELRPLSLEASTVVCRASSPALGLVTLHRRQEDKTETFL